VFAKSPAECPDSLTSRPLSNKDHLDELLQREGDYVLIKGRRIIGIFADRQDAIEKAVALFGTEPALIKRIVVREPIVTLGGAVL